jgi:phosphoribosylformylglycinamidine (FGAM) synthase-like amidotransferase family enzyme
MPALAARGQVPFAYASASGAGLARGWPDNPNGSEANAAGVTNARGNVLALMPHPERAQSLAQVPLDLPGAWGERRRRARSEGESLWGAGPGAGIFLSLAYALGVRETAAAR